MISPAPNPSPLPFFHSASVQSILPALARVQQAVGTIGKNAKNENIGNSYADLQKVTERLGEAFATEGIFMMQPPSAKMHGSYLGVDVTTIFYHLQSGEYFGSTLTMFTPKIDAHAAGSAITYGRRYAVLSCLSLATADDDGTAAVHGAPAATQPAAATPPEPREASEAAVAALQSVLDNIKGLKQELRRRIRDHFRQRTGRDKAGVNDLPLLQLLYTKAINSSLVAS